MSSPKFFPTLLLLFIVFRLLWRSGPLLIHAAFVQRKNSYIQARIQGTKRPSFISSSSLTPAGLVNVQKRQVLYSSSPFEDFNLRDQHDRLTSTPTWSSQELDKNQSAFDSLWGIPSMLSSAHSGLVNVTGAVVSTFRSAVLPGPVSIPKPKNTQFGSPNYDYDDDENIFLDDYESEYASTSHDDTLHVWDDPPPPPDEHGDMEEDASPVISQLQQEVIQMLGPSASPNIRIEHDEVSPPDHKDHLLLTPVSPGQPQQQQQQSFQLQREKGRIENFVTSLAVSIYQGPKIRLLRLVRSMNMLLRALIASFVLFGTTFSGILRRIFMPRAKSLPRPDLFQRTTTTFTRLLHETCPELLAHPIFYGRPFPWQWKGWQPQRRPSSPLFRLPPLSALLKDLGEAVTLQSQQLHNNLRQSAATGSRRGGGERRRRPPLTQSAHEQERVVLHNHPWAWSHHTHFRDDSSKSILRLEQEKRNSLLASAPTPEYSAPLQLDTSPTTVSLVTPYDKLFAGSEPLESLDKELIQEAKERQRHMEDYRAGAEAAAAAANQPFDKQSEFSNASSTSTTAAQKKKKKNYKGPELFTSFFPQELEDDSDEHMSTIQSSLSSDHSENHIDNSAQIVDQKDMQSVVMPSSTSRVDDSQGLPSEKEAAAPTAEILHNPIVVDVPDSLSREEMNSQAKAVAEKSKEKDEIAAKQDSAYGRLLADLTTEPMPMTEDLPVETPPDLPFEMPFAVSIASLEQMDKRMVILAVESALTIQSKTQLWRYIEEVGISPLLAALKKSFRYAGPSATNADDRSFSPLPFSISDGLDEERENISLRTQAVEAILHLMNIARDLRVLRAAVEGPGLFPVVGKDLVSDLIDIIEEPLLLVVPKIIKPRDDQMLYRGQRAAVEVLLQLVLASDISVKFIQEDGRLWNALQQMTAEGMYPSDSPTYATCHKLLAAIGHNEWRPKQPGQRGLRILSFDGGGTRGVLSIALLKQVMDVVGKDVFETFDVICGTSTGGILAVLFGIERKTIADAEALYDQLVSKIFASSPLTQTAKLLLRQAYYDEIVWEEVLKQMLGDDLMIDSMGLGPVSPKVFVASLSLKTNPSSLFLWRNYAYGPDQKPKYSGSFRIMVRDALRATTAAPTFFSPLEKDDAKYCDGAFLANNPTGVALNEVRTIYPGVPVEVVVSIGTGVHRADRSAGGSYGWEGIVNDLINCATNTEVTHEMLSVFLPRTKYYRFNPKTENFPLDETRPERLQRMKRIAREYFWKAENKERLNQLVDLLRQNPGPLPQFTPLRHK